MADAHVVGEPSVAILSFTAAHNELPRWRYNYQRPVHAQHTLTSVNTYLAKIWACAPI